MKKSLLLFFFALFLLPSCQSPPKRCYYPDQLGGDQVAFYKLIEVPENEGDMLVYFQKDGTFKGMLDGDDYDYGQYHYELSKEPGEAFLNFQSSLSNQVYHWNYQLSFNTPYSGSWQLIHTDDPNPSIAQIGVFRFLR